MWETRTLHDIMTACIILHNMIIEDERDEGPLDYNYEQISQLVQVSHEQTPDMHQFIENLHAIRNRAPHHQLRADLVEHLWNRHLGHV
jgi:hypothetical protein